jgi:hypothetical protein
MRALSGESSDIAMSFPARTANVSLLYQMTVPGRTHLFGPWLNGRCCVDRLSPHGIAVVGSAKLNGGNGSIGVLPPAKRFRLLFGHKGRCGNLPPLTYPVSRVLGIGKPWTAPAIALHEVHPQ